MVRHPFFLTRQNELSPNHPNKTVKQTASTIRLDPACPEWYLAYSRTKATAPIAANAKKTKPVTSSQSCPSTRLKCPAVALQARRIAPNLRLLPICRPATRVITPSFRAVESFVIPVDFIKLQGYNISGARSCITNHCDAAPHLKVSAPGLPGRFQRTGEGERKFVDQHLKQLMKELGEAINESLADSDQIAEVVSKIKEDGFEIFLVLEATIGVSKPGEKNPDKTSLVTTLASNPEFKISDQDLKFLKSLRIKLDDDAA